MNMPRFVQLFFCLGSFSLVFVVFWNLDVGINKFSFNSEHVITLQQCSNQHQDQFESTYGTYSLETTGPAALNKDLETKESEDAFVRSMRHASPKVLDLQYTQYARKKLIHNLCSRSASLGFLKRATLNDIPHDQLSNLIVDDRHGIIYCYIPKVACTEWKSIMIFLSESLKVNGVPYKNHSDIPRDQIHGNSVVYLNRSHRNVMNKKIKKYKKFLFVRHPFVRLISAYRDKFEKKNDYFYNYLAVPIMKRYRKISPPASAERAHAAGIRPTFSEFIHYIVDLPDYYSLAFQEHWRQMYYLCHPCQIEYDFVGKMETMNEDAQHLLHFLKVDHIIQFPQSPSNRTEESWINDWFTKIPFEWRRKLYEIYELDFKLFGYSLPENFLENASPAQSVISYT
ncbi:carbohydrate sulfotransferase 12-like [Astyanax mexicanus]|uniref:carbohydrate sulfotransferase 12-like n=1 Tax=Astyanax mexicanus TaxID=7994 RepID=UPI0020CAECEC|nr:carbohydrate sulfotransferase 12-like [Astyanax mexicanus]